MKQQFVEHIKHEMPELLSRPVIVAVSGGVDSMVLLNLLHDAGADVEVAHCNFHLRGDESDGDAAFVQNVCKRLGVLCHIKDFESAEVKSGSVQKNARDLRYAWFNELSLSKNALVATAHHEDDLLETFFMNLMRGSGLKGLSSIPAHRENIRRPLLIFTREQIETYAGENKIDFRHDSSNDSDVYLRNHLRHKVIPMLKEVQPDLNVNATRSINFIAESGKAWKALSEQFFGILSEGVKDGIEVDLTDFDNSKQWLLKAQLLDLGFTTSQLDQLFQNLDKSGRYFRSPGVQLLVDRKKLIIYPLGIQVFPDWEVEFSKHDRSVETPHGRIRLEIVQTDNPRGLLKNRKPGALFMNYEVLEESLVARSWQKGDVFKPLGMSGTKKVSDFFIDRKIPVNQKHTLPLIISGKTIAAVVGIEIANEFKLSENPARVLIVSFEPR